MIFAVKQLPMAEPPDERPADGIPAVVRYPDAPLERRHERRYDVQVPWKFRHAPEVISVLMILAAVHRQAVCA